MLPWLLVPAQPTGARAAWKGLKSTNRPKYQPGCAGLNRCCVLGLGVCLLMQMFVSSLSTQNCTVTWRKVKLATIQTSPFPRCPAGVMITFVLLFCGILRNVCLECTVQELLVFLWIRDRKGSMCIWHLNYVRSAVVKMWITLGIA